MATAEQIQARAGRLQRSLQKLTIGTVKAMDSAKYQRELEGLSEREEQFQIAISGHAEEFPVWTDVDLVFGIDFVSAPDQREDSELVIPHFTYGSYIDRGGPVGVLACVTEFDINDRKEVTGCTLSVGAVSSDVARSFHGWLHATFQGYGMPADSYGDISQLDFG